MEVDNAVVATGEQTETQVNAEENKPAVAADAVGGDDPQAIANDGEQTEQDRKRKGGWARQNERLKEENRLLREQVALKSNPQAKPAEDEQFVPIDREKWVQENPGKSWEDLVIAEAKHVARYEAKQALKNERAEQEKVKGQTEFQQRVETIITKGAEKYGEDFESGLREIGPLLNDGVVAALLETEHPEDVVNHLIDHPEELTRIAKLNARQIDRAIVKLDEKFAPKETAEKEEKPPPPQTKAPPPITPVRRQTPAADPNELRDDLPVDEWTKRRWRQVKGK